MYVVAAVGGTPRRIDAGGDAIQAAWSPSGRRIAFWSVTDGQRDIYTVPSTGGPRVAVTLDAALDWAPSWSPDGRYLYFSSDRGGEMNLWRIAIDEASGRPLGQPEPVTNGVQASAALPRFSKDGARLAFRSLIEAINPVAIPFDPVTARAGEPRVLDRSNNFREPSDVSPDGKQLVFFALGERQEDIFIGDTDGSHIRRLTDDAPRDRAPEFTRDGKSVLFYSTRGGNWAIWTIHTDGSGLQQIATASGGVLYPIPSPLDDSFLYSAVEREPFFYRAWLNAQKPAERLTYVAANDIDVEPMDWSSDGSKLACTAITQGGHPAGVGVYDLAAHRLTMLNEDAANGVRWLPDNRRLMYFDRKGSELVVFDIVTRQRTVVPVDLPGPALNDVFALSRDGRTI
ncbi:MAG TPA: hypothetical protein VFX03_06975, partial [Thermomicrobiales bacterium]|nr:hypothetical protein [Thermomicrobiales bacterium]